MAIHQAWTGSISFGLIMIPVKLYNTSENKEFSFNQLCPNGHKIKYVRWCPVEEREISYTQIKKGYRSEKDSYIVFEKSDLDKIKLKTTKSIDIREFVDVTELDPILIQESYYVAPVSKKGNEKAYQLLAKVLSETKQAAVGKIILRYKENVVALRPYQRGIVMHVLRYLDEIKPPDEIPELSEIAKHKIKLEPEEISLAKTLVEKLSSKGLDLTEYSDSYAKELRSLVEAKSKGKPRAIEHETKQKADPPTDLLGALKESMRIKKSRK
jgi:DNA end-binding protein Ku